MKILHLFVLAVFLGSAGGSSWCAQNPQVLLKTDLGEILIELYPEKAPITAANFLRYVDEERFEGAMFYRVVTLNNQPNDKIKIEVIQGGLGYTRTAVRLDPIPHEITRDTGILHQNGTISMARSEPGSASSEFFICINDQPELDFGGKRNPDGKGFAAFGRVIDGMEVVRRIQNLPSERQMLTSPLVIHSIQRFPRR